MKSSKYIWKNGKFVKWEDAQTHVLSHTLHYSGGVFEGIRFYKTDQGSAIFRLKEHTQRFFYSAKTIHMHLPYSQKEFMSEVAKTVKKNNLKTGYIRPLAYYGYGNLTVVPKNIPPETIIAAWEWGAYLEHSSVRVKISNFIRIHPASTVADAKLCGNYINSILAVLEAQKEGHDEALFLDHKGYIAEASGENFFLVKDKKIYTPELGSILPGITRSAIIELARDLGYKVIEKKLKPKDLKHATEAFFSGTAVEITPIASVDNIKFKFSEGGPITKHLKEEFLKIVTGKNPKYKKWLTYVK